MEKVVEKNGVAECRETSGFRQVNWLDETTASRTSRSSVLAKATSEARQQRPQRFCERDDP